MNLIVNDLSSPDRLRAHSIILRGQRVTLRPLTEDDWPVLLRWNQDPDVLFFADGADVQSYSLPEVQGIYRGVCAHAFCYIMERVGSWRGGEPVGECWLQEMNLPRLLQRFPDDDLRRIDLSIGEKTLWGQGLGTETIGLLTAFAFLDQQADRVFGCDIADYNPRSLRAFEKNGYELFQVLPQPPEEKAGVLYDVMLTRERYLGRGPVPE